MIISELLLDDLNSNEAMDKERPRRYTQNFHNVFK